MFQLRVVVVASLLVLFVPRPSGASPLLGYMGGNESCADEQLLLALGPKGMRVYRQFVEPLVRKYEAANSDPLFWFVSCFRGTQIYYYLSPEPEKLVIVDEVDKGRFFSEIGDLIARHHLTEAILLGHSHGGWLIMQSLLALQVPAFLFTIDPISRLNCTLSRPRNCRNFPSDISEQDREDLRGYSLQWFNYYQTKTLFLHSGPVPQADMNRQFYRSHRGIVLEPSIWEQTEVLLGLRAGDSKPS